MRGNAGSNPTQETKFTFKLVISLHNTYMYSMPNSIHVLHVKLACNEFLSIPH